MLLREKMESQIRLSNRPDDMLRHNSEYNGMLYKYDLPTSNLPIVFRNRNQLVTTDKSSELTATESLLSELECDKDTAFESFVIKMQQNFNNEVDMYGEVRHAGDCDLRVLEFGTPIPFEVVTDEEMMKRIRSMFRVNTDIPGSLELVHPNKFLPNLRPVEEFRHTPIIPISEKDLRENQQKIEERNRKGYYVEIRKDTIYFYTIAALALSVVLYTFMMVNEKQNRIRTDLERNKMLKKKYGAGRKGANLLQERTRND